MPGELRAVDITEDGAALSRSVAGEGLTGPTNRNRVGAENPIHVTPPKRFHLGVRSGPCRRARSARRAP